MNFITIELKTNNEGGTGVEVLYSGVDRKFAESKYHEALAFAATHPRPCHAVVLLQSDGVLVDTFAYIDNES